MPLQPRRHNSRTEARISQGTTRAENAINDDVIQDDGKPETNLLDLIKCHLSWFFDANYYLASNPDLMNRLINPLDHYLTFGLIEGRRANEWFDEQIYIRLNPDVSTFPPGPTVHYLLHGIHEGRQVFEAQSPDGVVISYLRGMVADGDLVPNLDLNGLSAFIEDSFDAGYYRGLLGGSNTQISSLEHFLRIGRLQGFAPNRQVKLSQINRFLFPFQFSTCPFLEYFVRAHSAGGSLDLLRHELGRSSDFTYISGLSDTLNSLEYVQAVERTLDSSYPSKAPTAESENGLSVLIPVHRERAYLRRLLESLAPDAALISSIHVTRTPTNSEIFDEFPQFRFNLSDSNGLFSQNVESMMRQVETEYVLVCGSDIALQHGALSHLMNHRAPFVAVTPGIYNPLGELCETGNYWVNESLPSYVRKISLASMGRGDAVPIKLASFHCVLLRVADFLTAGGFREHAGPYWEDTVFWRRWNQRNFKLILAESACVVHDGSIAHGGLSTHRRAISLRSRCKLSANGSTL